MNQYLGELAALCTAIFWTVTAIAFERAALRVGSLSLNIIRLVMGFAFLTVFTWILRGIPLPVDATGFQWFWLAVSGLIGFVFGDLFLFKSYSLIGSRLAMLMMTLAPPIAAVAGWLLMHEVLTPLSILGMLMTLSGIALAIFNRDRGTRKMAFKFSPKGLLFAFLGAAGQGIGLVFSKYGMQEFDPFAATQIRLLAGIAGFTLLITLMRRWGRVRSAISNRQGMGYSALGSFFGPFLGVSFSLLAIKYTATGVAATIMAIVPVLIIPPAILIYKEKVHPLEIAGACISIAGVSLLFLA
jgi:drug/metabolite transporter (DMT)-like permease